MRIGSGSNQVEDEDRAQALAPLTTLTASIEASIASRLSFAFHQNDVPALRELAVINGSDTPLHEVTLCLQSEPAFFAPRTWHIDNIGGQQRYHITQLDTALDGPMLGRLTEAERASVSIVASVGGQEIARKILSIELLARNQWGGIGLMPEMVAAFVQPNDPAVEHLLKGAAEILRQHGRSGALDGYAGGPKRSWELASAIWGALGARGLDYALPPPSFEREGQKVRGPSRIAESGLATCLDLTLLISAALEHAGLNPLVVFTHGHAFGGVWLSDEEFTTSVVDDVTALRKRLMLKELVLFESTLVTQRPCPTFAQAIERGARQVSEAEGSQFNLAVDIRRARIQRIRPLAMAEAAHSADQTASAPLGPPVFDEPPIDLPDVTPDANEIGTPVSAKDRLERWQRRLLDLSLRNTLLNFRARKRAIALDAPDPGRLEDLLAAGHAIRLMPRPTLMQGRDPRSQSIYESRTGEDPHQEHALEALRRDEVLVGLDDDALESGLTELYRAARAAFQEGGANILYLALGFLSWTPDAHHTRRYRAPLVLIPVALQRRSIRSGFRLVLHDDQPRFNPTLLELLRQDFHLTIPIAEGELPRDESGLDIAGIWKAVGQAIKDVSGWEVTQDVVLATFSFAKHLMWKDLVERTDQLRQSPVVRHLIDTPQGPYLSHVAFPDPQQLDSTYRPEQVFCPLPADSSQLTAVLAAAQGKDFVLVGPPGTGKSQTIANLIAQCLAEDKSVLFVSEKMAALGVVYRRLHDIRLGEFCLELHSNKARKADVLEQLRRSWDAKGHVDQDTWRKEAQRLSAVRDRLNTFVAALHRKHPNGLSPYLAIGRVLAGHDQPAIHLSWPSQDQHDEAGIDAMRELVDRLDLNVQAIGTFVDSPLAIIAHGDWSPTWQGALLAATQTLKDASARVEEAVTAFQQAISMPALALDRRAREGLVMLSRILPEAVAHDWRFFLRTDAQMIRERLRHGLERLVQRRALVDQLSPPLPGATIEGLRRVLNLLAKHREVKAALSLSYGDSVAKLDLERLKADWNRAEQSIWPLSTLRAKAVEKVLMEAAGSTKVPNTSADLENLATLQALERDLDATRQILADAGVSWAGAATDTTAIQAKLEIQRARPQTETAPTSMVGALALPEQDCPSHVAADQRRLTEMQGLEAEIDALGDLRDSTDGLWAGLATNLQMIERALAFQRSLSEVVSVLTATPDGLSAIKTFFMALLSPSFPTATIQESLKRFGLAVDQSISQFDICLTRFAELAGTSIPEIERTIGEAPTALAAACQSIQGNERKLHAWCAWRKTRAEAISTGLAPLVATLESGQVPPGKLRIAFETAYCRWWLNAAVDTDSVLRTFLSIEHEKRITDYRALDDQFTELTRALIRAKLCAQLPAPDDVSRGSDWGLLRREMQRKRGHMALRDLIGRLPGVLPKLAPCLLMSPLSIAQFLPTNAPLFDVVVFDEASQIPVWDAIGAIARGRQVVMVGDPKQLPPTTFFDRAEADAEEAGDIDSDLESILDECLASNLPTLNLSWHYRSRHESLIAFSNHYYYKGGLVTFPSPVTDDHAVSFHLVSDGIYEKGGARINKPEARALVSDLVERLKDPAFHDSKLTIGVVTFNAEQQSLIEDLLDEERRKAPEIEPYFAEDAFEPVFVKNLENVQGDERDIMYFSITYGPDITGAVSMNLGPMTRSGGERRLNVAITRARYELRIFSSLRPEQLDLARTSAVGMRDLKHFLEFAERGPRAIAEATRGGLGMPADSPFEEFVAAALASRDWEVHPQVGASSFRIDLGVVDPDARGRYLAGIECDGATYHRSATARDRDKLREQVLRGLGWEIVRIWSTDWWHDPTAELDKVCHRLDLLLKDSRARRAEESHRREESDTVVRPPCPPTPGPKEGIPLDEGSIFHEADPATAIDHIDPEKFYDSDYDSTLLAIIEHVIDVEGPVHAEILARRVARAHGWLRTGPRIQDRVTHCARDRFPTTEEHDRVFFWRVDSDTSHWERFRRPQAGKSRPVDEIALVELVALAREMRGQGLVDDEAIHAMAHATGLQKLRAASRPRLEQAFALACEPISG